MKINFLILLLLTLFSVNMAFAQKPVVFSTNGKAIHGYDPVAYFTEGKPVKGDSLLTYTYDGANWQFASQANLNLFRADPAKYAPQYGGYCAFGTSRGYKAPTEPNAWTIEAGKLYLNYNTKVRETWDKDRAGYIEKADKQWNEIKTTK
ncbi:MULTISPECIES: YHS domain-containing (seleno)protein [unclassified Spirosoma]|uniref:YHS domain-containing (seleno)protein n=1 Tax=unclassified Spirosoma TaxID=2621999 RepID=UPI00095C39C8|nr:MULTISPECIES: YHS domain-containing (seleno)protein [unclassified Spirosoma]MBN8826869.1 YHS domain-containing protein [Spirosoma sp.]OJW75548.1 MAG: YHS domain protein [Spirosoma sp. 48-14]